MPFFHPPISLHARRAAFAFLSVLAFFGAAEAWAEPFFGSSQPSTPGANRPFNYSLRAADAPTRATRAYAEYAVYQPRTLAPVARPELGVEDQAPAPEIESRGSQPTVSGSRAIVRHGVAYAPSRAPEAVKRAIWAVNNIRNKPYKWGGGHGSFSDNGYDCSGSVSYALHHAGVLSTPIPSRDFMNFGQRGKGRWVTVYARNGHTFAMIAGLRMDTTDFNRGGDVGPRWHLDGRDTWGFAARHPVGL